MRALRIQLLGVLFAAIGPFALANDPTLLSEERYVQPPKPILDAVMAPWHTNYTVSNISPNRSYFVIETRDGMPKVAGLAKPYHNLAGVQIDPTANRHRRFSMRGSSGIAVISIPDLKRQTIQAPKDSFVGGVEWAPGSEKFAYIVHEPRGSFLHVYDLKSARSRRVSNRPLLMTLASSVAWTDDGSRLVAVFVPERRAQMPAIPQVAVGPQVKVSDDKTNALRTYAGLMNSPHEMDLLEYFSTGQLAIVDANNGRIAEVGKPAMIETFSIQPDASHVRVTLMERPFSYLVTSGSFPERDVIWDAKGEQKVEVTKRGLRLGTPADTPRPATGTGPGGRGGAGQNAPVDEGKRSLSWRPDGAGLSFLQLAPRVEGQTQRKDRVMLWKAPYGEKDMDVVFESENRISNVRYSEDGKTLFLTQTVDGRNRTSAVRLDNPTKLYTIVETRGETFYDDPGDLAMKAGAKTGSVVRMSPDGKYVYLSGTQYSRNPKSEAPRPFIDKVEIETGKKERIFQSKAEAYESASLFDDEGRTLLVTRQSPTQIGNTYLVTVGGSETQLTQNRDFAPDLSQAYRETLVVTRNDGIKFEVTVTLPPGQRPGSKPPAFFWFYPSEFTDQAAYDRTNRTFNKNAFRGISPSNKLILLRAGYALVEPDCPIIGATERKNDAYIPQLRNNLSATIDALSEKGLIDRTKLGIGGHSYGAFSTANAMIHTPFFKAGIAGDGNFNRLLTPFGFQSEQRQLWESREVYLSMSPMLHLEQLSGALLLYHGSDDQNMGTDPINSVKLFQALEALGKPAALYMYPYEDHGQVAEETVLDQWARFVAWLDKWVKGTPATIAAGGS